MPLQRRRRGNAIERRGSGSLCWSLFLTGVVVVVVVVCQLLQQHSAIVPVVQAFHAGDVGVPFRRRSVSRLTSTTTFLSAQQRQQQSLAEEDTEPAFISATTAIIDPPTTHEHVTRPRMQRKYETFVWKPKQQERDENDSKKEEERTSYNINYRVEGPVDGPPILLIHGFGANVNHFRDNIPVLAAEGYRVYALDLLGFGASDKPRITYSMDLFTELVMSFVETMDPNRSWILAGNSIGGLCSLATAAALPHRIQGVVLFNCSGGMSAFRYEEIPTILRPVLYFFQRVMLAPDIMGKIFFQSFKTRNNVQRILGTMNSPPGRTVYVNPGRVDEDLLDILLDPSHDEGAAEVFLAVMAGDPGPTPESILPDVTCPILALWGDADPWTPVDSGPHAGNRFGEYHNARRGAFVDGPGPDFELHVVPAGHCPHDECPDEVHAFMLPWLQRITQ